MGLFPAADQFVSRLDTGRRVRLISLSQNGIEWAPGGTVIARHKPVRGESRTAITIQFAVEGSATTPRPEYFRLGDVGPGSPAKFSGDIGVSYFKKDDPTIVRAVMTELPRSRKFGDLSFGFAQRGFSDALIMTLGHRGERSWVDASTQRRVGNVSARLKADGIDRLEIVSKKNQTMIQISYRHVDGVDVVSVNPAVFHRERRIASAVGRMQVLPDRSQHDITFPVKLVAGDRIVLRERPIQHVTFRHVAYAPKQ